MGFARTISSSERSTALQRPSNVWKVTTGLVNEEEYFALIEADLGGAVGAKASLVPAAQTVAYRRPNPQRVRIAVPGSTHVVELARRAPAFASDEARLLKAYAVALQEFGQVPRVFANTASEDVLTRAIAVRCTENAEQARMVETVLQAIIRLSATTYEGNRVVVNVCLDMNLPDISIPLAAFLKQPWAPVLGSGLNSALLLAGDGSVVRVIDLETGDNTTTLAPALMCSLAIWTRPAGRIALSITRSGEIYVFDGGHLLLVRRNSRWRAFPLAALQRSGWFGTTKWKVPPAMKRLLLMSLLDASAAHHGACLGIVHNSQAIAAVDDLVGIADQWAGQGNTRRRMFDQTSFLELSRRHRLELLSMDGATLLDQSGTILTAGAILRVDGGSIGGGRTAAAHAIAKYGVGIKVSQDGPIKAFVTSNETVVEHFSMG